LPVRHQGGLKNAKWPFFDKMCTPSNAHVTRKKSATNFLYVKTVSGKVVRHSLAYLSVKNMVAGGCPHLPKILAERDPPPQKPISNRYSFVAPQPVTPSENS